MIYLAAVVHDKKDPGEHTPYVSTALGPYKPLEVDAIERGKAHLRDVYATEDVREIVPQHDAHDFDTARVMLQREVGAEHNALRLRMERERAESAMAHIRPEVWPSTEGGEDASFQPEHPDLTVSVAVDVSGAVGDLDRVIQMLGCNPGDV